ncbi:MAG TPA: glycine--tRNA ligase subunit beta [Tissierellaceae bacterium]|nr:glycine--tRNA ligase subunit beta [Tissierellaceae bacterium]
MTKSYLLEIGVEEIPARYVKDSLRQLDEYFTSTLNNERLKFESIEVYSSPRRLTTIIKGIDDKQEDLSEEVKGPSKKISFDEQGNPTKALQGFMRGQKVGLEDIFYLENNGEEYVYARVLKKGLTTKDILFKIVPEIIKSINFPKSMKWGGKDIRFARPIRWIVSLLDDDIVDFEFEGIPVSNTTRGHRFLGSKNIKIENIDSYIDLLKENYVIVDQNERKEIIKYGAERLAKEKGGKLIQDEALLDEVTNLVEYPTPLIGRIKDEYLKLPKDVVITPMKEHLRYFPVLDDKNRLLPYFITIRNGNDQYLDIVTKGNEKVLGARLEDAKFFFNDDISKPLEDYVEELKGIIFQEKLGTLYDKTLRVQKLSEKIASYLETGEETEKNLARAAYLGKADLVTKMVTEFTELQGVLGMEYAKISGENEIVSLAIFEQYLPRFSGDKLPTTTAGSILSIADKLDTIVGMFAINIQPTGSQDPFALRRNALGIINIILDKKLNLSLNDLIEFSLYIYADETGLVFDYNSVKSEINNFFIARIKSLFADMKIRHDVIEAVLSADTDQIYDMKIKAEKINDWINNRDLSEVLQVFNRVSTLALITDNSEVQRDLLTDQEIQLYDSYNSIEAKVLGYIDKKEYDKALDTFVSLKEPLDNFLDNVMVMVDDEELKNNRLGLLRKIYDTMMLVCDLSKIVYK